MPPHAHSFVETPALQIDEPLQPAFESTPEKFVAFVNRMAEARSPSITGSSVRWKR